MLLESNYFKGIFKIIDRWSQLQEQVAGTLQKMFWRAQRSC
jgi:hypothetical protein